MPLADLLVVLTTANLDLVPDNVEDVWRLPPGHPLQRPAVLRQIMTGVHGDVWTLHSAKVETELARQC